MPGQPPQQATTQNSGTAITGEKRPRPTESITGSGTQLFARPQAPPRSRISPPSAKESINNLQNNVTSKSSNPANNNTIKASASPPPDSAAGLSTTNFRLVSACKRCRHRKNKCDQKLPKCTGCARAGVACVGFDPIAKRMIPRSYVYYLETRVRSLEMLLRERGGEVPEPSKDFEVNALIRPGVDVPFPVVEEDEGDGDVEDEAESMDGKEGEGARDHAESAIDPALHFEGKTSSVSRLKKEGEDRSIESAGLTPINSRMTKGKAKGRAPDSTPRVTFAQVMRAAKNSVSIDAGASSERRASRSKSADKDADKSGATTSMREAIFNQHKRSIIEPAPFPDEMLGRRLANLYFQHANPQIPVLHQEQFMSILDRVYTEGIEKCHPRELYFLNMVFAIGSGIILETSNQKDASNDHKPADPIEEVDEPPKKRTKVATKQRQPEEYHASAMKFFDSFVVASSTAHDSTNRLEELQAILLLASLALLQPVAEGLWYITGRAMRLAMDLNLHCEDVILHSEEINVDWDPHAEHHSSWTTHSHGKLEWLRDLRRRLWWCVYAFDRLVSSCVGRPVGIQDEVITTKLPSLHDDRYITPDGFTDTSSGIELPTSKLVARHYLRLRLLQSEILQVQQQIQAVQARSSASDGHSGHLHTKLESPYLAHFDSFREWRFDLDQRLLEWKESAPQQEQTGVEFKPLFLELNYWQAIVLLYRPSLAIPDRLRVAGELSSSTGEDIQSPGQPTQEAKEDEDMIFMKLAQAGQRVLEIYRELHGLKLVNYTYLATQHLFGSGVAFLSAIWHSPLVRSHTTLDDVRLTIIGGMSVLANLREKCPPAEACGKAIFRMGALTTAMVQRQTEGFGAIPTLRQQSLVPGDGYFGSTASRTQPKERNIRDEGHLVSGETLSHASLPEDDVFNMSPTSTDVRPAAFQLQRHQSGQSQTSVTNTLAASENSYESASYTSQAGVNHWELSPELATQRATSWRSNLSLHNHTSGLQPAATIARPEPTSSVFSNITRDSNVVPNASVNYWAMPPSDTVPSQQGTDIAPSWNAEPSHWTNSAENIFQATQIDYHFPDCDLDTLLNTDTGDVTGENFYDAFASTSFNFDVQQLGGIQSGAWSLAESSGYTDDRMTYDDTMMGNGSEFGLDFGIDTLFFGVNGGWQQ